MTETCAPYENQLIGSFLVGLGYHGGRNDFPHPIRANLNQQGPLDAQFGDLFVGATSFLAIEFKRFATKEAMRQEVEKWDLAELVPWLNAQPKKVHRYHVMAFSSSGNEGQVSCQNYFPCLLNSIAERELKEFPMVDAQRLIEELFTPREYGGDPDEVLAYLKAISKFRKTSQRKATGGKSVATDQTPFMGVTTGEKGQVKFIVESSFSMALEYELRHERQLQRQREAEFKRDRSRDFGI